jgi:hypothetical protein
LSFELKKSVFIRVIRGNIFIRVAAGGTPQLVAMMTSY